MGKVFVAVGMSLDGFLAGPNGSATNPLGDGGHRIHEWIYSLATFREMLGMGEGGETNADNDFIKAIVARAGAHVMGRRMFDGGELGWPENPPFHAPVFVLTHSVREPWVRQGGTTFHFVTDGFDSAFRQAKAAAGGKDVRISAGADVVQQALKAGVVDEMIVHLAPVFLGSGVRLFDRLGAAAPALECIGAVYSPRKITHLTYRVVK